MDFEAAGGALAFIKKYAPDVVADRIKSAGGSVKLAFQDYDGSPNSAP